MLRIRVFYSILDACFAVALLSKKVILSAKASLSFEKKKEYVFESRLQTSKTKKAVKYRPFLSIKSPTKQYVAFGGSAEYKNGKALVVDFTLDQVANKPMKFFGKYNYYIYINIFYMIVHNNTIL